jgi:hypothetical protein
MGSRMKATAIYPKMKPIQVWRYDIPDFITMPGTDTNVMPEILAPTIPNATIYQGDLRLPLKNASLLDFLPVTKRL